MHIVKAQNEYLQRKWKFQRKVYKNFKGISHTSTSDEVQDGSRFSSKTRVPCS